MKIFDFDPSEYRSAYAEQDWVHIRGGVTDQFVELMRSFVSDSLGDYTLEGSKVGGRKKKTQALFEFPPECNFPEEVFEVVSSVTGLRRPRMTLSERHVNAYFTDTDPDPLPHKDRFASQVSVGLPIDVPEESRVVIYPSDERDVNPFNTSAELINSLPPERHPDIALKNARGIELDDAPGDVVMFPGYSIWHLRRNGAASSILYLKMNDFGNDPLGEDPSTGDRRERTLRALSGDGEVDRLIVTPSRRLDSVSRHVRVDDWSEVPFARLWEQEPYQLDDVQFAALREMNGERSLAEIAAGASSAAGNSEAARRGLLALAERGIVDLVDP